MPRDTQPKHFRGDTNAYVSGRKQLTLQAAAAALACGTGDGEDSEDDSEVDGEYIPGEGEDDDDDMEDDDDDDDEEGVEEEEEEGEEEEEEVRGNGGTAVDGHIEQCVRETDKKLGEGGWRGVHRGRRAV